MKYLGLVWPLYMALARGFGETQEPITFQTVSNAFEDIFFPFQLRLEISKLFLFLIDSRQ
jgi:hypothetical protein